jgi:hypothetical protein
MGASRRLVPISCQGLFFSESSASAVRSWDRIMAECGERIDDRQVREKGKGKERLRDDLGFDEIRGELRLDWIR